MFRINIEYGFGKWYNKSADLAQAITLIETTNPAKRVQDQELL